MYHASFSFFVFVFHFFPSCFFVRSIGFCRSFVDVHLIVSCQAPIYHNDHAHITWYSRGPIGSCVDYTHTHTRARAHRTKGVTGFEGREGANGVRGGNRDMKGDGDGHGAGTRTGMEANEGTQDGNGDGSGDGAGMGMGAGTEMRAEAEMGTGARRQDEVGEGGGEARSARNGTRVVDAMRETGET